MIPPPVIRRLRGLIRCRVQMANIPAGGKNPGQSSSVGMQVMDELEVVSLVT